MDIVIGLLGANRHNMKDQLELFKQEQEKIQEKAAKDAKEKRLNNPFNRLSPSQINDIAMFIARPTAMVDESREGIATQKIYRTTHPYLSKLIYQHAYLLKYLQCKEFVAKESQTNKEIYGQYISMPIINFNHVFFDKSVLVRREIIQYESLIRDPFNIVHDGESVSLGFQLETPIFKIYDVVIPDDNSIIPMMLKQYGPVVETDEIYTFCTSNPDRIYFHADLSEIAKLCNKIINLI
jgi:hypothetical protein